MHINYIEKLKITIQASIEAGKEIIKVYNSDDFNIEHKDDNSPLTKADLASNKVIKTFLEKTNIPILSEEGKEIPYEERKNWPVFWLVDPLDGTKEFIKRNGEFTVNIALIENNHATMGVIYTPVVDELFFSIPGKDAFKMESASEKFNASFSIEEITRLSKKLPLEQNRKEFVAVGSKSHMNDETRNYLKSFEDIHKNIEILSKGSSLKLCLIAEGKADIYPRFAPTMEWDIAAGHAIINGANGLVIQAESKEEVVYNKENLLNPWFIAATGKSVIQ